MPLRRVPRSTDLERVARLIGTSGTSGTSGTDAGAGWVPTPPDPPSRTAPLTRTEGTDELEQLDLDLRRARRPGPLTAPEQVRLGRWSVSSGAVVAVLALVVAVACLFVVRILWAERVVAPAPGPSATAATAATGLVVTAPSPGPGTPTASPAPSTAATLVVHVTGQVTRPGLVRLTPGARVADALTAAGGATRRADLAALNLARPVLDGEQVRVPAPGETVAAPVLPPVGTGGAGDAGVGGGTAEPVDLNTADAAGLDGLPGVGPVLAQRILDWRAEHGRFTSVDELGEVSGIGEKLMARLRERVRV